MFEHIPDISSSYRFLTGLISRQWGSFLPALRPPLSIKFQRNIKGKVPPWFKFEKCCHIIFLHFILAQFNVLYDIFMRKFKSAYIIPLFRETFPMRFKIEKYCHIIFPLLILHQFDVLHDISIEKSTKKVNFGKIPLN